MGAAAAAATGDDAGLAAGTGAAAEPGGRAKKLLMFCCFMAAAAARLLAAAAAAGSTAGSSRAAVAPLRAAAEADLADERPSSSRPESPARPQGAAAATAVPRGSSRKLPHSALGTAASCEAFGGRG